MAFPTTRWSVVLDAARDRSGPGKALHELCESYWRPLYVYLRRQGHKPQDAEDLVQGFLAGLLEREAITGVERDRGRFRAYLLGALRNYLTKQRDRANAQKRGGGRVELGLTIDREDGEAGLDIPDDRTPEAAYAYAWAMEILGRARTALRESYVADGRAEVFDALEPFLLSAETPAYREVASRLDMTEPNARVAVHRLRTRFGTRLREEVADTVASETEIDDEIRAVIDAIRV